MKIELSTNIEDAQPIILRQRTGAKYMTLSRAEQLLKQLKSAVERAADHFRCAHETEWACMKGRMMRCCHARGSVKIGERWYCKAHAKKYQPFAEATNA